LLDSRFTQQFLGNGLPNWIKQRLINSSNFSEALGALIKFFRLHKTEKEEKIQKQTHTKIHVLEEKIGVCRRRRGRKGRNKN